MTAPVQTVGPADPNAPFVQKVYAVVSAVGVLIGAASTFGLVTGEQAASLGTVGTSITTLVVSAATALAAFRTKKQINNGTFDKAPEVPTTPAMTAVESIAMVANQFQDLTKVVADGVQHVQDVAGGLAGVLTGGLSSVKPGGLLDQVLRDGK